MELRRAASGEVKVICRTVDSRPGGKGKKPSQLRKKDSALVGFSDWFGSISMMYPLCMVSSQLGSLSRRGHPETE